MIRVRRYLDFRPFDRKRIIHSKWPGRYQDGRLVKHCPASVSRDSLSETSSRSSVITKTGHPPPHLVSLAFSSCLSAATRPRLFHLVVDENDPREIERRGWNNSRLAASVFAGSLALFLFLPREWPFHRPLTTRREFSEELSFPSIVPLNE